MQLVIRRMKDEGCDAVVLGCTEIPLIIGNKNSPLPFWIQHGCWRRRRLNEHSPWMSKLFDSVRFAANPKIAQFKKGR